MFFMKSSIRLGALMLAVLVVTIGALFIVSNAEARAAVEENDERYFLTRVVLYHAVSDTILSDDDALYTSPTEFENQMRALKDAGYTTVFADEYGRYTEKTVAVTFDDGYENVYTEAFPILKKYGIKATVFLITSERPNHLTDAEIREMVDSGLVLFASHTVNHPDMTTLTYDEMIEELKTSKEDVERVSGQKVTCFAYPHGAYNDDVIRAVKECGYKFAYKTDMDKGDIFSIPRIIIWRATTTEMFAESLK